MTVHVQPEISVRWRDITVPQTIRTAMHAACARVAPLWPLKHFVAVNPFLGFSERPIADAAAYLQRVVKADILMPADYYLQRYTTGDFQTQDLDAALALTRSDLSTEAVMVALAAPRAAPRPRVVATVADILDKLADGDRDSSRTAFMINEISRWCAAYFDEGQAAWRAPWHRQTPYQAWREAMRFDRNAETMGIVDFRATIASLPDRPDAAVAFIIERLGIPAAAQEDYLFRALFDIQGWAGYARYLVWDNALYGRPDDTLLELLAIRVAWGFALFEQRTDLAFRTAWAAAMQDAATLDPAADAASGALEARLVAHAALEHAFQRKFLAPLQACLPAAAATPTRPDFQIAFCIDVRSEVFRRALEASAPSAETIGFAGFFGFPIEYVPIGNARGGAQCPVLLKPSVVVCEAVEGASAAQEQEILTQRQAQRRAGKTWKAFKQSAISSFTYVETMGLRFLPKLISDSFGQSRPVPDPTRDGLREEVIAKLGPRLEPRLVGGRETGFAPEARTQMAEAVLRGMSLTENFARLVVFAGHGSASVNNPHASGLDCGACGGHTGEANARVAAALLNDPTVRQGLASRGILIPDDTLFLAALHNTTTDAVTLFHTEDLPRTHRADGERLRAALNAAAALARRERAAALGLANATDLDAAIFARAHDWSQVRPEWGLAGNAAFIAAPRTLTEGLRLDGRAFLHSYDWKKDDSFGVLELIMTAPMVVASWINLQYFASSVNNDVFGSGNKTLHNVVGALGVLEGNGGDLRVGLPLQSVHDGAQLVHEPLRLNVVLNAPLEAINRIIAARQEVRDLVDNQWVYLFTIDETGALHRYWGGLTWTQFYAEGSAA